MVSTATGAAGTGGAAVSMANVTTTSSLACPSVSVADSLSTCWPSASDTPGACGQILRRMSKPLPWFSRSSRLAGAAPSSRAEKLAMPLVSATNPVTSASLRTASVGSSGTASGGTIAARIAGA